MEWRERRNPTDDDVIMYVPGPAGLDPHRFAAPPQIVQCLPRRRFAPQSDSPVSKLLVDFGTLLLQPRNLIHPTFQYSLSQPLFTMASDGYELLCLENPLLDILGMYRTSLSLRGRAFTNLTSFNRLRVGITMNYPSERTSD